MRSDGQLVESVPDRVQLPVSGDLLGLDITAYDSIFKPGDLHQLVCRNFFLGLFEQDVKIGGRYGSHGSAFSGVIMTGMIVPLHFRRNTAKSEQYRHHGNSKAKNE